MPNQKTQGQDRQIYVDCPYCKADQDPHEVDVALGSNEDFIVFDCADCEMKFMIKQETVYTTKSDCKINGLKHKFKCVLATASYDCFDCQVCDEKTTVRRRVPKVSTENGA